MQQKWLRANSFQPAYRQDARVLILGSMPGIASLEVQQYYGHPRNAFWPIISHLCHAESVPVDYAQRIELLQRHCGALWDVIGFCQREGSLDSRIEADSILPNPIPELIAELPHLNAIACNGGKAFSLFKKHHLKLITQLRPDIEVLSLPSTSPAYAAMSFEKKLAAWSVLAPWFQQTAHHTAQSL